MPTIRARKHGPEVQSRRDGAPGGAASLAGMPTPKGVTIGAPLGAPSPSLFARGKKRRRRARAANNRACVALAV
jgi:hypothetical protein